ncbi:hypothetical protein CLOM_g20638 [Closterium sp. NIES-68]|nr:hypothetical protein CLOM_g20638 [Closterium sp. NIES-68]GJP66888.1 hypothetical protein CLOP_g23768 [Closterium sp. NIES-67]GJP69110.1 hypothetical protein CLOP_g25737 [Closterium sp. NIES-67]
MSTRALLVLLLSLTLLASATAGPTTEQIVSELKQLQSKLIRRFPPRYIIMSQFVAQLVVRAETVPATIDWSAFAYNTLLIPTDAALGLSGILAPPQTAENFVRLFQIVSFNIIRGMRPFAALKALPVDSSISLVFKNGRLFRKKVKPGWALAPGTSVALTQKGKPRAAWSQIVDGDLHKGSSFIAHGVNRMQTP